MPRLADKYIEDALEARGAVCICGPKGCGKTATAMQHCKSAVYLDDPAACRQSLQMSQIDPFRLLKGDTPRLIDEWEKAPFLWDAVRREVDDRGMFGQFMLTESAAPGKDAPIFHSGTGRICSTVMEPMTLYESGDSDGSVSLEGLFGGDDNVNGYSGLELDRLAFLVCRGGWPGALDKPDKAALKEARHRCDDIVEAGISASDGVRRNPDRVRMFLRAYSRAAGTQAGKPDFAADMKFHDGVSMDLKTMDSYISALKSTYTVTETEAFRPVLRSGAVVRSARTREFTDPSFAAAALKLKPEDLVNSLDRFGVLFRSMCLRDLRVYARCFRANLYHYRDSTGLEVDAVLETMKAGCEAWGAIETDLGIAHADELAAKLRKFRDRLKYGERIAFLMIITGSGYAYRRPDGVLVVPIGCLKP
ncbi:MAG: DUF4143 domain-containing protein [Clostridia bacterium]|nr:DUF4143 domain-containing protein [Clostridia bacterium]